jgi:hypothetical protein
MGYLSMEKYRMQKLMTMRDALKSPGVFGKVLDGDSWAKWRVLLIAMVGEELTADERAIFKTLTGRDEEPGEPVDGPAIVPVIIKQF